MAIGNEAGGAVAGWVDGRSGDGDIYAQRLTPNGAVAPGWPNDGLAVCAAGRSQYQLTMADDGSGGAFFAWADYRSGHSADVYMQRITGGGSIAPGWIEGGVGVATGPEDAIQPAVLSDGSGGAMIAWIERASGGSRIRLRRLIASGSVNSTWSSGIPAIGDSLAQHRALKTASDGSGGILLVWTESTDSAQNGVRALRVGPAGEVAAGWPARGVELGSSASAIELSGAIPDGAGDLLVFWLDDAAVHPAIRVQKVGVDGVVATGWPTGGATLCTTPTVQFAPALRPDGAGGCYVAWQDLRSGADSDIYLQHLTGAGVIAGGWPDTGLAVCEEAGDQRFPSLLVDSTGVVVIWADQASDGAGSYVTSAELARGAGLRFARTEAYPGRAIIRWTSAGPAAWRQFKAYRRLPEEEWKPLTMITADRSGGLTLDDNTAVAGTTIGYRLALNLDGTEILFPEVLVVVPAPKPLALGTVRFGNSRQVFLIGFTLASGERAPIAIFDVSGRRIVERDLGEFGPGDHRAELVAPTALHPGIYFVRLSQGAAVRTARVALYR